MREVVHAIFDVTREGCRWRALPPDFPPGKTVSNDVEPGPREGPGDRFRTAWRRRVRRAAARDPDPRVACIDRQSAQTAFDGPEVGTDGGKKVRGRNRPIAVDTMGLLLAVVVPAGTVEDARAAQEVCAPMPRQDDPRWEVVHAENQDHHHERNRWLRGHRRRSGVMVVSRPVGARRFIPLKRRGVVDRTWAGLGRSRRWSRDDEPTTASREAVIQIARIHHDLRRLAPQRRGRSQRFRFKGHRPKQAAYGFWNRLLRLREVPFLPLPSRLARSAIPSG